MTVCGAYSAVADEQLDVLERGDDMDLYNAVLETCELVFTSVDRARSLSTAIITGEGVILRLPVPGRPPHKIFWSSAEPRIEVVFPDP